MSGFVSVRYLEDVSSLITTGVTTTVAARNENVEFYVNNSLKCMDSIVSETDLL